MLWKGLQNYKNPQNKCLHIGSTPPPLYTMCKKTSNLVEDGFPTPAPPKSLIVFNITLITTITINIDYHTASILLLLPYSINIVIIIIQHQGDWTGAVRFDHRSLFLCHSSTQAQTGEVKQIPNTYSKIPNTPKLQKIPNINDCSILLCHLSTEANLVDSSSNFGDM